MWNFKGNLWNSMQNVIPNILNDAYLRALRFKSTKVFVKQSPDLLVWHQTVHYYDLEQGGIYKMRTSSQIFSTALQNSMLYENHIFQWMGKIFLRNFKDLKFHTKYITHTLKDGCFIPRWKNLGALVFYELVIIFLMVPQVDEVHDGNIQPYGHYDVNPQVTMKT